MSDESTPATPLGPIALALSGGGYRAAAFHLGTLRTLREAGLLESVDVLSTVSGGTIVGASYALSQVQHQSFERFYGDFLSRLRSQRPVHRATHLLTRQHNSLPRRTLIAAQARALDEQFYGGAKFGEIFDSPLHIGEVIFNATDFRCGLPFRFQKSRSPRAKIGNGKHWMPHDIARQIRIADVVAASSCFPGGFEPIGFPHDFTWDDRESVLERLLVEPNDTTFAEPLPLMDGGVADNQGLGSLRLAFDRRGKENEPPIGLMLISDADSPNDQALIKHHREPRASWLSVNNVILSGRVLLAIAAIAMLLLGYRLGNMLLTRNLPAWWEFVEVIFSFGVVGVTVVLLFLGMRVLKRMLLHELPDQAGFDISGTIGTLNPSWLGDLLLMRFESLFAMSNNVFMKSVRDLRYREMFDNKDVKGKVIANLIYDLPRLAAAVEQPDVPPPVVPSDRLVQLAARAAKMPTTLWFDDERQLDIVVLSGQATTCNNLLLHIQKRLEPPKGDATDEPSERLDRETIDSLLQLRSRLLTIWQDIEQEASELSLPSDDAS